MFRIFVALVPPATIRAALGALGVSLPGVRWAPVENLHLTLRFIGEVDSERADAFASALERVRVEPFVLPVAGVGVFPSRGPAKVLWAGVGHGHTRLFQLRKQVDEALLAVDSALDVHNFHPHFTVGRMGEGCQAKLVRKYLELFADFEAPPFRVDQFHLLASEFPVGRPPVYRALRSFALSA